MFLPQRRTTRVVNKERGAATATGRREGQQCPLPAADATTPRRTARGGMKPGGGEPRWRSFCLHARLYVHVKEDLELRLETTHKHQEAGAAAQPAGSPSEPPPPSTQLPGANLALSSVGGGGARAPKWARLEGGKKKKESKATRRRR